MNLYEPRNAIPVHTPLGGGYVVYIKSNGMWENDEVCVAMIEDGQWRHFSTEDIKAWTNKTYSINKDGNK